MSNKNLKSVKQLLIVALVLFGFFVFFTDSDENYVEEETVYENNPSVSRELGGYSDEPNIWPPAVENSVNFQMDSEKVADTYLIILDGSGSMNEYADTQIKMKAAKRALAEFAMQLDPSVNLGMYVFMNGTRMVLPIEKNNKHKFVEALDSINASGGTPLVESMKLSYDILTKQAQKQGGYGRYFMIVVTDGASGDGDPSEIARQIAFNSVIEQHVIGFSIDDHSLNINGVTEYVTADSAQELIDALSRVAQAEVNTFQDEEQFE